MLARSAEGLYWLGRYVERTQGVCALLLSQTGISGTEEEGEYFEADWTSLLRIFHAVEVYHHTHKADVVPDRVLDLLVSDPLLPDSLSRSVNLVASEIDVIGRGPRREIPAGGKGLCPRRVSVRPVS